MAQIGSPPAGWYTDPSGQHHARFWDGTVWTEDVRDDLAPAAAPSSSANPVADTVASVAEAVAAVAANDVAAGPMTSQAAQATIAQPVFGDASFVVDYGTDASWGADSSWGTLTDADLAMSGALATSAQFAPMPTQVPEPMPSGPTAGWYPDPAARHEARFWDGTRWTEQVADHGQAGVDPLPGSAPTSEPGISEPGISEPAISWTNADLGGALATDDFATAFPTSVTGAPVMSSWDETLPAMTEAAPLGGDGRPLTAGQVSLASLPVVDDPEPGRDRRAVRPSAKVRVAGGFVLAGAVALLLGSAATWIEVTGPRVGQHWTATGVDLGDGRITVVLGLALALLGAVLVTGRLARFGGAKVAAMGALVAGAAATAVTAVDIADVADRATRLGVPVGAVSNVGTGLWIAFIGALFAVVGGLMAFANRQ